MDCPACNAPMIVMEREGIELDYCPACRGLWFDADELALLAEACGIEVDLPDVADAAKADTAEAARACPRCGKPMNKVLMGDDPPVVIDACPNQHGLWFDAGELGQVVAQHLRRDEADKKDVVAFLGELFPGHQAASPAKE